MTTILGEEALAAFRAYWNGPRLLDLITAHGGGALILWPIGVGKSCAIDRIIEAAVGSGSYDLVVALFPTRRVLEERAWIRTPPSGLKIVNLRPRPRQRCGDLDGPWRHFEQAGMAALGRVELCGRCPRRPGCYWPRQYGKGLEGAQVIFGTDAHLARSPDFGSQLAGWAGAARVLTLVDEINFARDRLPAAGRPRPIWRASPASSARSIPADGVRSTATGAGARSSSCGPRRPTCVTPTGGCRRSRSTGRSRSRPAAGKPTTRGSVSSGTTCSSSAGRPWNHASGTPTAT